MRDEEDEKRKDDEKGKKAKNKPGATLDDQVSSQTCPPQSDNTNTFPSDACNYGNQQKENKGKEIQQKE